MRHRRVPAVWSMSMTIRSEDPAVGAETTVGLATLMVDGYHLDKPVTEDSDNRYLTVRVYPGYMTDEEVKTAFQIHVGAWDGHRCEHSYDCCGHFYPSRAEITRTRSLVIVEQAYRQNV